MKARFLIINEDGDVQFTNSQELAEAYCDSTLVIDAGNGVYLGTGEALEEAAILEEENEGEEEES